MSWLSTTPRCRQFRDLPGSRRRTSRAADHDPADDFAPDLSPDGRSVAYHSFRRIAGHLCQSLEGGRGGPCRDPRRKLSGVVAGWRHHRVPRPGDDGPPTCLCFKAPSGGTWGAPVHVAGPPERRFVAAGRPFVRLRARRRARRIGRGGRPEWCTRRRPSDPPTGASSRRRMADALFQEHNRRGGRRSGRAAAGGRPRLVRFTPARPSIRADFAAGAGRFFFTLEERQADIWVAEITHR